jgi:hypothetical protein
MQHHRQKLVLKSSQKLAFQLPQKIFSQCNLQRCQTRSWKVQLEGKTRIQQTAAGDLGGTLADGNLKPSKPLH